MTTRPWLGLYVADSDDKLVVMGLATKGPAQRAGIEGGDTVLAVDGTRVESLADLFRKVWSLGDAGTEVPMTLLRDERSFDVTMKSADRNSFLKMPRMH